MPAEEKAFFANSDLSSLITKFTTNGTVAYEAGVGMAIDKTSGGWNECGLMFGAPTPKTLHYGDTIYFKWKATEINNGSNNATTNSYNLRYSSGVNFVSPGSGAYGPYIYTDGGEVLVHMVAVGQGSQVTATPGLVAGDILECKMECELVTGNMDVSVKGGALGSEWQVISVGTTDILALNGFTLLINTFASVSADCGNALIYYEWGDGTLDPLTVQDITATAQSSTEIEVDCTAFNLATTYEIYRDDSLIDTIAYGAFPYTDSGLSSDTEYTYKITALGTFGRSDQSAGVAETTSSPTGETNDSGIPIAARYNYIKSGGAF